MKKAKSNDVDVTGWVLNQIVQLGWHQLASEQLKHQTWLNKSLQQLPPI
ncbi:hypothetical protein LCO01nite_01860 [Lapidilactobacillus concavus]|nr:hypothetical protein [Lapidilactobacillus concavus]GEL12637.1 hypothetical protein LCO01nite_01860 [Lapidilactobacillus concavus]